MVKEKTSRLEVTLDDAELSRVTAIACRMDNLAIGKHISNKNYFAVHDSQLRHRINGCAAKAAFAKLFDCTYDPVIGAGGRYSGRGEKVYDFIVDGWTVKVSVTAYANGNLIGHPPHAQNPPDFLALMVGTYPHFVLKGFMASGELFHPKRYVECFKQTGRPAYIATQKELLPVLPE